MFGGTETQAVPPILPKYSAACISAACQSSILQQRYTKWLHVELADFNMADDSSTTVMLFVQTETTTGRTLTVEQHFEAATAGVTHSISSFALLTSYLRGAEHQYGTSRLSVLPSMLLHVAPAV
jgi:hypothetical protein